MWLTVLPVPCRLAGGGVGKGLAAAAVLLGGGAAAIYMFMDEETWDEETWDEETMSGTLAPRSACSRVKCVADHVV